VNISKCRVCASNITNMETWRIFRVVSDKFKLHRKPASSSNLITKVK
jgi:hypothetical protein